MAVMRESWTDARLDDLNAKVDHGFGRADAEFRELRAEMNGRFDSLETRFGSIDGRFDSLETRFDSIDGRFNSIDGRFNSTEDRFSSIDARLDGMQRTMVIGFAGIVASILGSAVAAVLATAL